MRPVPGLLFATLLVSCAKAPIGETVVDEPSTTGAAGEPAGETVIEGTARNSKVSAVVVAADGRVVHISGLSGWPTGVDSRQVWAEGRLVKEARIPRATQDADGAWSQGVAADSAPEWWLDDPVWSLVGVEPDPAPWTLRISDGSGNATTISRTNDGDDASWRYEPVTPETSSSGTYSGGEPATGTLSGDQLVTVWSLVTALEADSESHAAQRAMGTTQITVEGAASTRSAILTAGSANDLEALLADLRGG